jgi:hypothetical protein
MEENVMLQPSVTLDRPDWRNTQPDVQILTLNGPAVWDVETTWRLNELTRLRLGWDGYSSVPVKQEAADFVKTVLYRVMAPHIPAPAIVPISGGGVQIEWHSPTFEIELAIRRPYDAELYANLENGAEPIETQLISDFTTLSQILRDCYPANGV